MKTAISMPDEVFEKAERFARSTGRSRSEVYSAALREYMARHAPDEVTDALDRVVTNLGTAAKIDPFVAAAGVRRFDASEW
jgi:hypothetical protein